MVKSFYGPRNGESAWLWLIKAASGLVIVAILIIHFVVNHLAAPNGLLTYADVVRYYQTPVVPIMEIVFLAFVVAHALIGLRGIILDLKPHPRLLWAITMAFSAIGILATAYGAWLILTIAGRGAV